MIASKEGKLTLFLGNEKVVAAYIGNVKVYPNSFLEITESLHFEAKGEVKQLFINCIEDQPWSIDVPIPFIANTTSGIGPTYINIVAPNNESTDLITGTILVNSVDDLSGKCELTQDEGIQQINYSEWVITNLDLTSSTLTLDPIGGQAALHLDVDYERYKYTYWNEILTDNTLETKREDHTNDAAYSVISGNGEINDFTLIKGNNKSENVLKTTVQALYEGERATIKITQEAGEKHYESWINKRLVIDTTTFPASGGSSTAHVEADQIWTWNGEPGSGGTNTMVSPLKDWTVSDPIVTVDASNITVGNLSTTEKAATTITITTASDESDVKVSATITQAANSITYGIPTGLSLSNGQIPASGGTVSATPINGAVSQSRTFTSGDSDIINPLVESSSWSAPVTAGSKGTSHSEVTNVGTLTYYYTCHGKTGSASVIITQASNHGKETIVSNVVWDWGVFTDSVLGGASLDCTIPASGGGYDFVKTAQVQYRMKYDSGEWTGTQYYNVNSNEFTVSQTMSASLIGWTQSRVSASSRGHTAGGEQQARYTCSFKYNNITYTSNTLIIRLASNNPIYVSHTCISYTKNTTYRWPSDGTTYTSKTEYSKDCGYYANVEISVLTNSTGLTIRQCTYHYGDTPDSLFEFRTPYYEVGANVDLHFTKSFKDDPNFTAPEYICGGPSSYEYGTNLGLRWYLGGPPCITLTNQSGPLGDFHINYDLAIKDIDGLKCPINHSYSY